MIRILYINIKNVWFVEAIQEGYSPEIKFVNVYVGVRCRGGGFSSSSAREIAICVTAEAGNHLGTFENSLP